MKDLIFRLKYFKDHWKMGIHLVLGTYHFGVNNQWWSPVKSLFGVSLFKKINPFQMWRRCNCVMFRIFGCYFIPLETAIRLFPRIARQYGKL